MPNQPSASVHPKLMSWISCPSCGNLERIRLCESGVKIDGRDCVRWTMHDGPCTRVMLCHACGCSRCGGDTWIEKEAPWPLPPLLVGCPECNPDGFDPENRDDDEWDDLRKKEPDDGADDPPV